MSGRTRALTLGLLLALAGAVAAQAPVRIVIDADLTFGGPCHCSGT